MREILPLSDRTISQIAAGEIIENPASVVKELIENAIDANARKISIRLGKDVIDEIRISDDGDGIAADQIDKAFLRHSTSKLRTIGDLDVIRSLGFRGEALSSIANVSHMECITKADADEFAHRYTIEGGKVIDTKPIGAPDGTTMVVRDLFYNTPVRKKFLNSPSKESRSILETVETLALGHEEIAFHLQWDRKTLLHSHPSKNTINHIYSILGRDIAKNLIPVEFETESYRIAGFIGNNLLHRASGDREFLFVNGRAVKSGVISTAIRREFRSVIPLHRYPVYILYIDIDPVLIDVNIHPQKQTIRLSNENQLVTILERLVRKYLHGSQEIPGVESIADPKKKQKEVVPEKTIFEISEATRREQEADAPAMAKEAALSYSPASPQKAEGEDQPSNSRLTATVENAEARDIRREESVDPRRIEPAFYEFLCIAFMTYILFEDRRTRQILIVDQHAAHERILYEEYRDKIENAAVATQMLIEPMRFHLSREEMEAVKAHREEYRILGFVPEIFGEQDILIREVPQHILIRDFRSFFLDTVASLEEGIDVKERNIYKIMRMACRSAVKGGDMLSRREAEELLLRLSRAESPYTCPHGRPTMIHLKERALEKLFLREV